MNHDEGVASAVTRIAEKFVAIWNADEMARFADIYADDAGKWHIAVSQNTDIQYLRNS